MSTPVSAAFIRRCLRKITADGSLLKTLPSSTCAICMDDFMCHDMILILPSCHHVFHSRCILPWFSRNNHCPLCRRVFPTEQRRMHSVLLRTHSLHLRQQPSSPGSRVTLFYVLIFTSDLLRWNLHQRTLTVNPHYSRRRPHWSGFFFQRVFRTWQPWLADRFGFLSIQAAMWRCRLPDPVRN